ncbi:MAG: cell wall-binding repeat-containing protein [Clostridiales bacterium]|nr:cell wall-binding repeat-containing protein [Clostridiales bacterium]MCF8023594.1 cell wall-binding repeat-containing protein [Clostridiales bacterium]
MDFTRRMGHLRWGLALVTGLIIIFILFILFYRPGYYQANAKPQTHPVQKTANTGRLPGKNVFETSVSVSQTVYPATFADNKPKAVILVPRGDWRRALTAANVIHFPVDAPILYIKKDKIPEIVKKEIKRLDPEGLFVDGNVKSFIVGSVNQKVKDELKELKLKYRQFNATSIYDLAAKIDHYRATINSDHNDMVMVASANAPEYSIFSASWTAHAGSPTFFVNKDKIPQATKKALSRRPQDTFIYLLGNSKVIPPGIAKELGRYGHVQRIPGKNHFEMSTGFAGYADFGPNFGYWIAKTIRMFGWGIAEAGHNFIFVNANKPEMAIPAGILSHRGKHGPMLLVKKDALPQPVERYLKTVQPSYTGEQEQLFNYGWIIGDPEIIEPEVQKDIDKLLRVKMPSQVKKGDAD